MHRKGQRLGYPHATGFLFQESKIENWILPCFRICGNVPNLGKWNRGTVLLAVRAVIPYKGEAPWFFPAQFHLYDTCLILFECVLALIIYPGLKFTSIHSSTWARINTFSPRKCCTDRPWTAEEWVMKQRLLIHIYLFSPFQAIKNIGFSFLLRFFFSHWFFTDLEYFSINKDTKYIFFLFKQK